MPKEPTRVVSVRVPASLPDKVKAATGQPFSKAVVDFFVPFVEHMERTKAASSSPQTETQP